MKMYVECCTSAKKGTNYQVLVVDFGFRKAKIFANSDVLCNLADCKYSDIYNMQAGETILIGDIVRKENKGN